MAEKTYMQVMSERTEKAIQEQDFEALKMIYQELTSDKTMLGENGLEWFYSMVDPEMIQKLLKNTNK
jgi:hypothetical protein